MDGSNSGGARTSFLPAGAMPEFWIEQLGDPMKTQRKTQILAASAALSALLIFGCSSNSTSAPVANPQATTVTTTVSDPAACQAPNGQFAHVFVTITDVEASTNGDANSGDSSFVDLTPSLKGGAPKQVDLLGQANNNCFLASLGATQEIPAGNYQQIRIMLAPDSAASSVQNNACGTYSNCVVLSDGSMHDLALSSEAQTGLKIPSGQIAGGGLNVGSGQTEDLDIDFNTCSSIVEEGNGQFRLKPVLHAGEVSTTSTSINGTIVSSSTGKPLQGGTVVVAAEQPDTSGVDRIVMSTTADPTTGGFVFCPLPAGTYDIVAVGIDSSKTAYSAGVETGVQPGNTTGNIPLVPSSTQATITGQITSQNTSMPPAATVADVDVSVLQQAGASGPTVTIPLLPTENPTSGVYATAPGNCPAGTDCVAYTLQVPGVWPNAGAYASAGAQFTESAAASVNDTLDMQAGSPTTGATDCTPSEIKVTTLASTTAGVSGGPLTVAAGQTTNAATAAFSGCQ